MGSSIRLPKSNKINYNDVFLYISERKGTIFRVIKDGIVYDVRYNFKCKDRDNYTVDAYEISRRYAQFVFINSKDYEKDELVTRFEHLGTPDQKMYVKSAML